MAEIAFEGLVKQIGRWESQKSWYDAFMSASIMAEDPLVLRRVLRSLFDAQSNVVFERVVAVPRESAANLRQRHHAELPAVALMARDSASTFTFTVATLHH